MDNPLYTSEQFCRNMAWIDLLLLANHKDGFFRIRGIRVEIKAGQIGHSADTLAARWRWSRGKVLRFLNELETVQQIVQQKSNVITLITVVNWSVYQDGDTVDSTTDGTTNGQQTVQQTDTNKNDKKEKNEKNEKKPPSEAKASDPSTFKKCMDGYITFVKHKTGVEPMFSVAGQTALSKIVKYLTDQVTKAHPEISPGGPEIEQKVVDAWKWVLTNFDKWEPFHQGQIELTQIHKNLINIINRIKNGTPKKSGQTGLTSDQYREVGRMAAEEAAKRTAGS